jgi:hypothetical protein
MEGFLEREANIHRYTGLLDSFVHPIAIKTPKK